MGVQEGSNLAYFAGAQAEGEESGATTAGAGAWNIQGVQKGSSYSLLYRSAD